MAEVWIPSYMRSLTGEREHVPIAASTVRQVVDGLDRDYPGIKEMLCDGDQIIPGIAVILDGEATTLGMLEPIHEDSEVHFLPALGGGAG